MSSLAPLLQGFFSDRLITQRRASAHTIASYRDTIRLLLTYLSTTTGTSPAQLDFAHLDAPAITAFLSYLETERGNSDSTRNTRLAAIHALFRYAYVRSPEHADLITRVLAITPRRRQRPLVNYLTADEITALVAAPDQRTWHGRRDHTILQVACQTGLRAAELLNLNCDDVHLGRSAFVRCEGKGRKQRHTPLTRQSATTLHAWLDERGRATNQPLLPTITGARLSHDALARLVRKHATTAANTCATLTTKNVTPHTMRHAAAMALLHAGVDTSVIALWLGHASPESTQAYLHADMSIKERALARITPTTTTTSRYTPDDTLLAYLDTL